MQDDNQNKSIASRLRSWVTPSEPLRRKDKIILAVLALVFVFVFYVTLDANKYRATVRVIEGEGRVGVNPTDEQLDFGDLSPGTSAVRRVNVVNGTPMPVFIAIVKMGEIASLIDIDANYFTLPARADQKIEFSMYMPASGKIDYIYDGRVYLFKIPKPF